MLVTGLVFVIALTGCQGKEISALNQSGSEEVHTEVSVDISMETDASEQADGNATEDETAQADGQDDLFHSDSDMINQLAKEMVVLTLVRTKLLFSHLHKT